jgi:BirA family biotin operon repressor/biotin-[acetyl-CoA-carboxylase] ligase
MMHQDLLLPELILPHLKSRRLGTTIHHFLKTGSTNDAARQLAEQGAPEGTLVLAEEQTLGEDAWGDRGFLSGVLASIPRSCSDLC